MNLHLQTCPDFHALFEAVPNLCMVLNRDIEIVAVTGAYCRATLTIREEILGRNVFDVFPHEPDDDSSTGVSSWRVSIGRVLESGLPDAMAVQKHNIRRPASEGGGVEERYWSSLNTPVLDDNCEVSWIIHKVEDVTELTQLQAQVTASDKLHKVQQETIAVLRNANRALAMQNEKNARLQQSLQSEIAERRRTEENLRSASVFNDLVIENIPAMIVVKDAKDHRFMLVNRASEQLLGIDRNELIGKNDFDFFPKEQAEFFVDRDRRVFESGEPQITQEEPINTRHNGVRILHTTKIPVFDEQGRPQYLVAVCQDMTERKRTETALQAVNEELEKFAYAAAHDLKAPLRVIDNASKWLEDDLQQHLTDDARENMNLLRGRVGRMEKLLDDMLEYSHIGRRAGNHGAEMISGDALMDNVLTLLAPPEGFRVDVGAGFADIQVNRMPLQQILLNLVGNAIKHHDRKGGHIEVTADESGEYYVFAVKDDGPGIPVQFHHQIFEMFETLKPKDQVEGSGMGLAMVQKNIEVFGGSLDLESSEGKGSTFRFTWPKQQRAKEKAA